MKRRIVRDTKSRNLYGSMGDSCMCSPQLERTRRVSEWRDVISRTIPKSGKKRDLLVAFFDWLLAPVLIPQLQPAPRRSNLLRKIRTELAHLKGLQKALGQFGVRPLLDSVYTHLLEVEQRVVSESQFRTYAGVGITAKSEKTQGNIVETQRLFIAVLVARKLYPTQSPFAVVSAHDPHGGMRSQRAIELRVRRYARTLTEAACNGVVSMSYFQFKHAWVSYQYQSLLDNKPRPLPMPIFRRLIKLTTLKKSELRILKDLSALLLSIASPTTSTNP